MVNFRSIYQWVQLKTSINIPTMPYFQQCSSESADLMIGETVYTEIHLIQQAMRKKMMQNKIHFLSWEYS